MHSNLREGSWRGQILAYSTHLVNELLLGLFAPFRQTCYNCTLPYSNQER